MNGELSNGWLNIELPEIATLNMGQSPPSNTYNLKGEGLPFFQGKAEFGPIYPTPVKYCSIPSKIAEPNDILVSVRAPVGPTNLCQQRCCIGRGLAAVRPLDEIPSRFLFYYFRSIEEWLSRQGTGSTFTAIARTDLEKLIVPLPPLPEQRRIVAKLEALLGKLDACQKRLGKIPLLLKRFRQSVLAAACSGILTAEWRGENPVGVGSTQYLENILSRRRQDFETLNAARYKDANPIDSGQQYEHPNEWAIASMDQLTCLVTSGSRGWAEYYSVTGALFIRAQNINTDKLLLDDIAYVQPPDSAEGRRTRVRCNDLLITITGANVTKSALVDVELDEAYVSQHVALVRPVDTDIAPFLFLWIVSPAHGRAKLASDAYGAGKPGLNLNNIRGMAVALPSLPEQHEIVQRVGALFALADQIEARYARAKTHVDRLQQSILAKAFRGELVPQDPNDEPASALLERIRAERELMKAERPTTRRRGRQPRGNGRMTAEEAPKAPDPEKEPPKALGPRPAAVSRTARASTLPADETDADSVMAVFRQVAEKHGAMEREDLLRAAANRLGHQRLGGKIRKHLEGRLLAAVRRRILTPDGPGRLRLETASLADYTADELAGFLRSILHKGETLNRNELSRRLALHLGFQRVTANMQQSIAAALRVAVEEEIVALDGENVRRS